MVKIKAVVEKKIIEKNGNKMGWWFAKFLITWPEDGNPLTHVDLLIANEIVKPILSKWENDIELWRVHRRFANDDTGHQFSFIFYTQSSTAASIFNDFRKNRMVSNLRKTKILRSVRYDRTDKIRKPRIEDTCDPIWSDIIQRWWPQYAMAVSRLWLGFVTDKTDALLKEGEFHRIREKLELFQKVENSVHVLWQTECSHPLLHHLNAIFGYIPIAYIPRHQQHITLF